MSFEFDAESLARCMGVFFCLLHSGNITVLRENNSPFKHLLLRRMLEALNTSYLGRQYVAGALLFPLECGTIF